MITWMQRHKKWLIVTIWISTIAFVGAGFVGWGSYDYGKSNGTVAMVNGNEVSVKELQNEYSALYSQYQQMFGERFNQELAKQLKLEDIAFQKVLQKNLILNYAQELGLTVTDEEIARELVQIPAFLKDGKFDKNTYMSVLQQNRKSTAEFEEQLKSDLLVQKVQKIFNINTLDQEVKNFSSVIYAQDRVSVSIIDTKDIKVNPTKTQLKKYWEQNKNNYKSPNGYKIKLVKIDNIDGNDKKAMKKVALKQYLALKKDTSKFTKTKTIYENSNYFEAEDMKKLQEAKDKKVLKPFYKGNNYYVVQLDSKVEPQALPYDEVKSQIKVAFIQEQKNKIVKIKTDNKIKAFQGKDIGFVSRESKPNIKGLTKEESEQFIGQLFNAQEKISSVNLQDKVVVFKITDSKLAADNSKNDETVKSVISNVKNDALLNELLTALEKKYEIKSFMEKN